VIGAAEQTPHLANANLDLWKDAQAPAIWTDEDDFHVG